MRRISEGVITHYRGTWLSDLSIDVAGQMRNCIQGDVGSGPDTSEVLYVLIMRAFFYDAKLNDSFSSGRVVFWII